MKTPRSTLWFSLFALVPMALWANGIEVAVIGLTAGSAPAFEESFDKQLRKDLAGFPELYTTDYLQTLKYRKKINFDEYPTVSRKLVESLKQYTTDSTIFIWGSVKKYSVTNIRKNLFRCFLRGEITVSLSMYSLRYKEYAYCGDVVCSFEKENGFVLFGSVNQEVSISGQQRTEIIDNLVDHASQKSATMIMTVIHSEQLQSAKSSNSENNMDVYQIPSVRDVFSVPSVEGASVIKNKKKVIAPAIVDSTKKAVPSSKPDKTPAAQKK